MCGLLGGTIDAIDFTSIAHRGPDDHGDVECGPYLLGHTRLTVQGDVAQPYTDGDLCLTYNGELWDPHPGGDTPVVAGVLSRYGTDGLKMLHGMFALAWTDGTTLWLARDAYGEVPLHWGYVKGDKIVYGSEVKALISAGARRNTIRWVKPGTYLTITGDTVTETQWAEPIQSTQKRASGSLTDLLADGAIDRMTSDAPVAVLGSGGLDSSAILALLVKHGHTPPVYTAVYNPNSADLRYTRMVCEHLGLDLHEIQVPEPTRETIGDAIFATEMRYKAQIEIALGCLPLAAALRADGVKVVLSGEGADELFGSYGHAYHGIQRLGWFGYRHDVFVQQHRKNFARTNKVFMAHGVEPRLPFLHDPLVRTMLAMSQNEITEDGRHPKAALASGVEHLLPHRMPWRPKRAFQTEAGLDKACRRVIANPTRYYHAEHLRMFGRVE